MPDETTDTEMCDACNGSGFGVADTYCGKCGGAGGYPRPSPSTVTDEGLVERGTFNCPICGDGKPHSHSDDEVKFRPDQLQFRLERLAEELARPVGFYSSMLRVYGTEYGSGAERALRRELMTAIELASGHTALLSRVEEEITAWAFAHDIDGAIRNELFARIRAAFSRPLAEPAKDNGEG